jgi:hypothetical protein
MTGAPTPAAAAATELWCSWSRSMPSIVASEQIRATKVPSGVVTL